VIDADVSDACPAWGAGIAAAPALQYEGLIDGGVVPLTSITRERALLLVVPREPFERLFNGETDESQVFVEVIDRDATASWRQALRPQAPADRADRSGGVGGERQSPARNAAPAAPFVLSGPPDRSA